MSIYQKKLVISLPWAIVIITVVLLLIFGGISIWMTDKTFLENEGPLWIFATGVTSGLVVTLAQYVLSWADAVAIDRFRRMGVENILSSRDEESYFGLLIQKANSQVDVLGTTGTRLMEDFADERSPIESKRALIRVLERGIPVRVLVANPDQLEVRDKTRSQLTRERFEAIAAQHNNFEVRYFDTTPIAAFVRADHELVVGPLLPGVASMHTPALHVYNHSPYAASYLNYFEQTWKTAKPLATMPQLEQKS